MVTTSRNNCCSSIDRKPYAQLRAVDEEIVCCCCHMVNGHSEFTWLSSFKRWHLADLALFILKNQCLLHVVPVPRSCNSVVTPSGFLKKGRLRPWRPVGGGVFEQAGGESGLSSTEICSLMRSWTNSFWRCACANSLLYNVWSRYYTVASLFPFWQKWPGDIAGFHY